MTTSAPMTLVDVLQQAKQELLNRGWSQGTYTSGSSVCLVGALLLANRGHALYAATFLADTLGVRNVAQWNDASDRTPEDILQLLDTAIARAEQLTAVAV